MSTKPPYEAKYAATAAVDGTEKIPVYHPGRDAPVTILAQGLVDAVQVLIDNDYVTQNARITALEEDVAGIITTSADEVYAEAVNLPVEATATDIAHVLVVDTANAAEKATPAILVNAMLAAGGVPAAIGSAATWIRGGSTYARTIQSTFKDVPCVLDWIDPQYHAAISNYTSAVDVTSRLSLAHSEAKIPIYYPAGRYKFTKFTIPSGGIIGAGKQTILDCTDTTADDVITYTGVDDTGILYNEIGATFHSFTVKCAAVDQKSGGAGIRINPGASNLVGPSFSGVLIRYIPDGIYLKNCQNSNISDCRISFYSRYGIYEEQTGDFEDDGDNSIIGCTISTDQPNGFGVKYRGGGLRFINNKVVYGLIGVDVSPKNSTSVVLISNNSIELQSLNCVRVIGEADSSAIAFTQVNINDNQLNGFICAGATLYVQNIYYNFNRITIDNNMISSIAVTQSCINVRNVDWVKITNNNLAGQTTALNGIVLDGSVNGGDVNSNLMNGFTGALIANASPLATASQVIGKGSDTYDPPSLANGESVTASIIVVTGAKLGDVVYASFSVSLVGIALTAYVANDSGVISVVFLNQTGGVVDLASGTIRVVVERHF